LKCQVNRPSGRGSATIAPAAADIPRQGHRGAGAPHRKKAGERPVSKLPRGSESAWRRSRRRRVL